jgi:hypothetical protein
MQVICSSEASVALRATRRYNPENLTSHYLFTIKLIRRHINTNFAIIIRCVAATPCGLQTRDNWSLLYVFLGASLGNKTCADPKHGSQRPFHWCVCGQDTMLLHSVAYMYTDRWTLLNTIDLLITGYSVQSLDLVATKNTGNSVQDWWRNVWVVHVLLAFWNLLFFIQDHKL